METATRPRFAIPKALEIKAFPVPNVRRCAAVWQSPPSACVGWSSRIPGSISAGCYWVQRAFHTVRRAVCAAGKCRRRVEHISYDTIEGEYDSSIFTAEKATQSFDKAFLAKKAIQDYVFTDGSADKSIERKFAEDLDAADEVCVYAKLPRTFQIPTPVGNYSPDWAIAFYEGKVKHIFFIAETKGTMESLELRPIEQAKISCAKKLFNEMSTSNVVYHDVDSYQSLLNIMNSL